MAEHTRDIITYDSLQSIPHGTPEFHKRDIFLNVKNYSDWMISDCGEREMFNKTVGRKNSSSPLKNTE